MDELPSGTVTFLFTDIEGSTRRWEADAAGMVAALATHDRLVADAIAGRGGVVFKHTGDGMCAAFVSADAAIGAAIDAQLALGHVEWAGGPLRARMGVHTGSAEPAGADYFGPALNRCARIMAAAHGGQIVCSASTRAMLETDTAELIDLGAHRLRDLADAQELFQVVHAGLDRDFPPLGSLEGRRHNLPAPRTTFIGRADELAALVSTLASDRLVTITGVGGCGKTRLALQASADVVDTYADGVFLVELAALTEPTAVASQVADALNLTAAGVDPNATIRGFFAAKRALLVLDNCEHLLDATAELCDGLLRVSGELRILATSREPLGVPGEVVQRLPSLALPVLGAGSAVVAQSEAAQLFVDRGRAGLPGFTINADNANAVAQICWRLDGIPLAIELAAARLRHLSPQQIADRLDDRFRLLTGGSRTALPRQQTLEAALDWSYDLLGSDEQILLRRLGVFVGRFSLDAAEGVGADDDLDRGRIFDVLTQLVDRSLVSVEVGEEQVQYRLLETIRHYALMRLAQADETNLLRDRHCAWFAAWARSAHTHRTIFSPRHRESIAQYDNLRSAFEWAVLSQRADDALALLPPLGAGWHHLWRRDEAEHWISTLVDATWVPDCPARALALSAYAGFAGLEGNFALSYERADVALNYVRDHRFVELVPDILSSKGIAASVVRNVEEGLQLLDEAVAGAIDIDEPWIIAFAGSYAAMFRLGFDVQRAISDLEHATELLAAHPALQRMTLLSLALARVIGDDPAGAEAALDEAMRDLASVEDLLEAVNTVGRSSEVEVLIPTTITLAAAGRYDEARAALAVGRHRSLDAPMPLVDTAYLVAHGAVQVLAGDIALGARLLGAGRRAFGEEGGWRAPSIGAVYVWASTRAREAIGEEASRAARAAGMAMPLEQAFALVE